jgi:hypothetical protein
MKVFKQDYSRGTGSAMLGVVHHARHYAVEALLTLHRFERGRRVRRVRHAEQIEVSGHPLPAPAAWQAPSRRCSLNGIP